MSVAIPGSEPQATSPSPETNRRYRQVIPMRPFEQVCSLFPLDTAEGSGQRNALTRTRNLAHLAFLADLACRYDVVDDASLARLQGEIEAHCTALVPESDCDLGNALGFFQVLPALAAARRWLEMPAAERLFLACQEHLSRLFRLVGADGTMGGHSSTDLLCTMRLLELAAADGLLADDQVMRLLSMAQAVSWQVMPDGRMLAFGENRLDAVKFPGVDAPPFARPRAPLLESRWFGAAGTWIGRRDGEVLAVQGSGGWGGHADTGGFVLYHDGRPLLIEAGCFACEFDGGDGVARQGVFAYEEPGTGYVASTAAHNCVAIGLADQERWAAPNAVSAITGMKMTGGGATVTLRFPYSAQIRRQRTLVWVPRRILLICDEIMGMHLLPEVRQWFHLAPGWQPEPSKGEFTCRSDREIRLIDLTGEAVTEGPETGVRTPRPQGWHDGGNGVAASHSAVAFRLPSGRREARFATLVALDGRCTVEHFDAEAGELICRDGAGKLRVTLPSADTAGTVISCLPAS